MKVAAGVRSANVGQTAGVRDLGLSAGGHVDQSEDAATVVWLTNPAGKAAIVRRDGLTWCAFDAGAAYWAGPAAGWAWLRRQVLR